MRFKIFVALFTLCVQSCQSFCDSMRVMNSNPIIFLRLSTLVPAKKSFLNNKLNFKDDQTQILRPYRSRNTSLKDVSISTFSQISKSIPNYTYLSVGITFLMTYHVRLFRIEKSGIKPTWRSTQAATRALWSQHVRKTEGWLYAIQTLRNAITANTFLATTVLSLLTVIAGRFWELIQSIPSTSTNDILSTANSNFFILNKQQLLMTQLGTIALCMLSSAYHFLQSARLMTHAGFMFPVSTGTKVDRVMIKSENAQWLGLRWLYISLAMISWAVWGEKIFLTCTLGLLRFFYSVDKAPSNLEDTS